MTEITKIEMDRIVSEQELRSHVDEKGINELVQDIKANGLLQPIIVRPFGDDFKVVCGRRRYEAHKRLGMKAIDCIIREMDEFQALSTAVRENEQREDFSPFDRARAYQRFLDMDMSQRELAKHLNISQTKISQVLAMKKLPQCVEKAMISQLITLTHAQELLKLVRFLDEMKFEDLTGSPNEEGIDGWSYIIAYKIEQVILHNWSAGDLRYAIDDYICGFMDDMFICSPSAVERHLVRDGWEKPIEDAIRKMQEYYERNVPKKIKMKYLIMACKFHAKHGDFEDYGE